jgi:hypothetical protein
VAQRPPPDPAKAGEERPSALRNGEQATIDNDGERERERVVRAQEKRERETKR